MPNSATNSQIALGLKAPPKPKLPEQARLLSESSLALLSALKRRARPLSANGGHVIVVEARDGVGRGERMRVSTTLRPLLDNGLAHYPDGYTCAITDAGRSLIAEIEALNV